MTRRLVALCFLLPVMACDPATMTVVAVGSTIASLKHTDKTIPDHVVSWATEQDCSVLRSEAGGPYCMSKEELEALETPPQVVCYRTLGAVDCYAEVDPEASVYTAVR